MPASNSSEGASHGARSAKSSKPAKSAKSPKSAADAAGDVAGDIVEPAAGDTSQADAGPVDADAIDSTEQAPLNRAQRRAQSRGKATPQRVDRSGKVAGQRGPVAGPRMWANRRSG